MAKQKSIFTLVGTLGNATFLKTKDGYLVKEKSSIAASKIASDPAYARTRENMAEFGRAGKASKVLRIVLRSIIQGSTDGRMISRLTKQMLDVIKMDATNTRGQRNVIDGEATLLEGFEFNITGTLSNTLLAPYTPIINRVTGEVSVEVAPFIPAKMLSVPGGATHFKIKTAAALVDFENATGQSAEAESAWLPINNLPTTLLSLETPVTAASTHPLFVLVCVEFVQEVNAVKYALQNGAFNACAIVKVDGGV